MTDIKNNNKNNKNILSDDLMNQLKLNISLDPHGKENIIFLKQFGDNHNHVYSLYELGQDSLKLIDGYINNVYDLDCIFNSEYIRYESYKVENKDIIDEDEDDMSFNSDGVNRILIDRSKKIIIDIGYDSIKILSFKPIPEDIKEGLKKIQFDGFSSKTLNSVHILAYNSERGMYLTDFKINDKYLDLDIELNYNEDFLSIYDNIIDNLKKDQIGLYLLHGTHGTGKTTLIRHIIRKINKRLIFISPSMASQFSNPDMIPFLMRYPNSVIIIEDSENIIKNREHGNDQSVSNLLNLSDGILGDCLKFQIICTFNTNKSDIDSALSRKGRLIESYEFKELSIEKSNNLLESLGYSKLNKSMRLSDIYNQSENHFDSKRDKIGFQ